nr:hypothetical protein [uncultured bacterium]
MDTLLYVHRFIDEYTTPEHISLVETTDEGNLLYKVFVSEGKISIEFLESLE